MVGSLVAGSGRLEWSGGSVVFLDRNCVKVFVVEKSVYGVRDGELRIGLGSWLSGEWIGKVLRFGNGCVEVFSRWELQV